MEAVHSSPIVPPPNFPVTWQHPDDDKLFWTQDKMHWPDPMPLAMFDSLPESGIALAAAEYHLPIRFLVQRINGYCYNVIGPPPLPPEELAAKGHEAEEALPGAIGAMSERWENEWLPEIKEHLHYWDTFDRPGASLPALLEHLDQTQARMFRLWGVHFLVAIPMLLSVSQFDEIYRELLGNASAFDAYKLLQGFPNKTVESGQALWKLSREAIAVPEVRRILEAEAADRVIPGLRGTEAGRAFLVRLDAYLREYGARGDKFSLLVEPSWIEDPTTVIKNLKDYASQPDRDIEAEHAALGVERDRAIAAARERLAGYPRPVVEQFEFLLQAAQAGMVLSEDHGFWIDYNCQYRARRVLLEFGDRFAAASVIDRATDIVHLSFDEIRETARNLPSLDRRTLIAERKAEIEHFRTIPAPPVLGTPPEGPPPDNPIGRTFGKFFGAPPQPATDPGTLKGAPGAPGVYRGQAKVVRSLAEASKVQPGDVLVAETTAPPWTPLFAIAGAVVTDTGGILSHCAVVAREYGIPGVVGVGMATAILHDGQLVEVDGNTGVVRVLGE